MNDTYIEFYHSKLRIFFALIFFTPFMIGFAYMTYFSFIERSIIMFPFFLLFTVLFLVLVGAGVLKLVRQYPYIIFTNEYLVIDPDTKSEIKLHYDEIVGVNMIESGFQKSFQVYLEDEEKVYEQFSLANKIKLGPNRWFGMRFIILNYAIIPKRDRAAFVRVIDNIGALKRGEITSIDEAMDGVEDTHKALLEKYDPTPIEKLKIDKAYFKSAYLYGFFIFLFMLVLFYLLLFRDGFYLIYIIVSFALFPFAKLLIDAMGFHKIRQRIDKQKGATYYLEQAIIFFDSILFHLSFHLFPFALLFLFIRFIVKKVRKEV